MNVLSLKLGTRLGYMLTLPIFDLVLEVLASSIRQEKEVKKKRIGKLKSKVSVFTNGITQKILMKIEKKTSYESKVNLLRVNCISKF